MDQVHVNPALTTVTNLHLLEGLRDGGNHAVWNDFVGRYRPMIVRFARKMFGVGVEDAEDVTQDTLRAFYEAYVEGKYDPTKGKLRRWLFGIANNQLKSLVRKKARRHEVQVQGDSTRTGFFARIPDDSRLEQAWMEEWQQAVFSQCVEELRRQLDPVTIEAYVRFAEKGQTAEDVARDLHISRNAVYLAKHHVLQRVLEMIPQMEEIF